MKRYFAKWLPVEGEPIGYGEKYINKIFKLTKEGINVKSHIHDTFGKYLIETRTKRENNDDTFRGRDQYIVKMKLFICSRDLHIGDTVLYPDTLQKVKVKNEAASYKIYGCFKVIGEISSEATWVKAGDKFNEDELILGSSTNEHKIRLDIRTPIPFGEEYRWIIYVKNASCGHFH